MQPARNNIFLLGLFALTTLFSHAEEVDRPPVDPPADFVPKVPLAEPDAPSVTFDPARNMKSRKDREAEESAKKRNEENRATLARIVAALDALPDARVQLFKLDPGSKPHLPVDRANHNPVKDGVFYGWKILNVALLENTAPDDARKLATQLEYYGFFHTGCFAPGMGLLWKDGERNCAALICLHCRAVRFVVGEETLEIPLSVDGKLAGAELYQKYFPGEEIDKLLVLIREQKASSNKKKKESESKL